jgi:outer membrane immunogenic protein
MTLVTRISIAMARRGRHLRAGLAALALVLIAQSAAAGDLDNPFLRGSFDNGLGSGSYSRWDGVYFGAQLGVANMDTDFGNEASQWVGYNLRNTTLESEMHPESWALMPSSVNHGQSYGAFLGYNVQWDQLVVGFDMAYNRVSSMTASSFGSIDRQVQIQLPSGTYVNETVTMDGTATAQLIDYATLRGRAGYAFGQFLPYAVFGAAVGRFNISTTANLEACGFDFPASQCGTINTFVTTSNTSGTTTTSTTTSTTGAPTTNTTITTTSNGTTTTTSTTSTPAINTYKAQLSTSKNNSIVAGFVGGLGLDVALTPNVFLRGEWEFVVFAPVSGIRTTLNTARVGIAVKF